MEKILFIAHAEADGGLHKSALEALSAARRVAQESGAPLVVGLFGEHTAQAAELLGGCGATAFFAVTGPDFAQPRYATDAAAVEALVKAAGATLVLLPATSRLSRVAAGVAQRLGGRADTFVTGLDVKDGALQIQRWYYRQRMVATLTREQRPWVLLLAAGCAAPYAEAPAGVSVQEVAVPLTDAAKRTQVQGVQTPDADQQTIRPDAQLLFVAGAGWTKKQGDGQTKGELASQTILGFLDACQASLGSSKSLVDQGSEGQPVLPFLTHLHQVGQTGSTPRHAKGLATCCHGEEPHVVGWRFITERRAVNLDASCGWAQGKADVLYVADAFAVMAKVTELLGK